MALLGARFLVGAGTVNSFRFATEIRAFQGDAFNLDLQLIDRGQLTASEGYHPAGLRYCPQAGSTLSIKFKSIDSAKEFSRSASQPFAGLDASVWRVPVLATDPLLGTVNLTATLTEGGVTRTFSIPAGILVGDDSGLCGAPQ